jgi:hypothetical protein
VGIAFMALATDNKGEIEIRIIRSNDAIGTFKVICASNFSHNAEKLAATMNEAWTSYE